MQTLSTCLHRRPEAAELPVVSVAAAQAIARERAGRDAASTIDEQALIAEPGALSLQRESAPQEAAMVLLSALTVESALASGAAET